eukprot:m.104787 g.104787  ORF g.104787 m.104787 type:complete len:70 (+) comp20965_c1_seq2:46-255(+)
MKGASMPKRARTALANFYAMHLPYDDQKKKPSANSDARVVFDHALRQLVATLEGVTDAAAEKFVYSHTD